MKFGLLKSKIEQKMLNAYAKNNFKDEVKRFKKYILENKSVSKIFYLYDELSSKRNTDKSIANEYINECVDLYNKNILMIGRMDYIQLNEWVKDIEVENSYIDIDNLFSEDVLMIEEKINSRKKIAENIIKEAEIKTNPINLPLNTMINVVNKSANNYINNLSESNKKELFKILNETDENLEKEFVELKESVISKLETMESEEEMKEKINEAIDKVKSEKYSRYSYYNLRHLNESL